MKTKDRLLWKCLGPNKWNTWPTLNCQNMKTLNPKKAKK